MGSDREFWAVIAVLALAFGLLLGLLTYAVRTEATAEPAPQAFEKTTKEWDSYTCTKRCYCDAGVERR